MSFLWMTPLLMVRMTPSGYNFPGQAEAITLQHVMLYKDIVAVLATHFPERRPAPRYLSALLYRSDFECGNALSKAPSLMKRAQWAEQVAAYMGSLYTVLRNH